VVDATGWPVGFLSEPRSMGGEPLERAPQGDYEVERSWNDVVARYQCMGQLSESQPSPVKTRFLQRVPSKILLCDVVKRNCIMARIRAPANTKI